MLRNLLVVYLIGMIITFIATVIWLKVTEKKAAKESRELGYDEFTEWGDAETAYEKDVFNLIVFIIGLVAAAIWPGIPVVLIGLVLYDKVSEKFPGLTGHMADEKEEMDDE